jgi:hypothetical protein
MPRARYDRLIEVGLFGPEDRVELLDGLLVAREPQGNRHAAVVGHAGSAPGDWKYGAVRVLRGAEMIVPLAAPRARIRVAALLP